MGPPEEDSLGQAASTGRGNEVGAGIRIVDAASLSAQAWDELAVHSPLGDAFQSHAWGELKRGLGWTPLRYVVEDGGHPIAVVSIQARPAMRRLPRPLGRLAIMYAPRGPILFDESARTAVAALEGLRRIARSRHALTLTIDPAWEEGSAAAGELEAADFRPAVREIQVSRTAMIIPVLPTDDAQHALLGDGTARNLNKARRSGVAVERVDAADVGGLAAALEEFYALHEATGRREGFLLRDRDYELRQWRLLCLAGSAGLWFACTDGRRTVGVLVLHNGRTLTSYAAGSADDADVRRTRANHLLQWEIIRWAAGHGFSGYDLGGVDTQGAPGFPRDDTHPLWNLYQFKAGFGAKDEMRIRAHEYAPHALLGAGWRMARRFR